MEEVFSALLLQLVEVEVIKFNLNTLGSMLRFTVTY